MVGVVLSLLLALVPTVPREDVVFFENMTFDEIRDRIRAGYLTVIVPAGGVEETDPNAPLGRPGSAAAAASERIARIVGNTLVAPVIPYTPRQGAPSRLSLSPDDRAYRALLEAAVAAMRGSGFQNVLLLAEAPGSRAPAKAIAEKLSAEWTGSGVRVFYVEGYAGGGDFGARIGESVSGIRRFLGDESGPPPVVREPSDSLLPAANGAASVFIEDKTPAQLRAAIAAGASVAIVPTGGTEKNGFHMAVGKHNFHMREGAERTALKLGNALVAPVLQYVPEGQATEAAPGVLSCAGACFEDTVDAVARDLAAWGFKDILLMGDNGGNQTPLRNVADRLNKEWVLPGEAKVFALTDYCEKSHEYLDAFFLAVYGWDGAIVGSHAGIKDTSQMLYAAPENVRPERIAASFENKPESGISGDPSKATEEFGRIAFEFKANAAVAQYRSLREGK